MNIKITVDLFQAFGIATAIGAGLVFGASAGACFVSIVGQLESKLRARMGKPADEVKP